MAVSHKGVVGGWGDRERREEGRREGERTSLFLTFVRSVCSSTLTERNKELILKLGTRSVTPGVTGPARTLKPPAPSMPLPLYRVCTPALCAHKSSSRVARKHDEYLAGSCLKR